MKGHRALGLSASLIGSGMAFRYPYFKNMMLNIRAVGGFDKEIELTMLRERQTIGYLEDAVIFDEKVQASEVFVKQRRRWLSAQIHYARYFTDALKELLRKGNADYFDKALQMLLPPRIILLGTVFTFTLISPLFNPPAFSIAWLLLFSLTILSLLFAVPGKFYHSSTLKALLALPRGFFLMMVSLFSTRGANKRFIHTNHTTSSISTK
jgi:cellulose synthase/poly-beta-1,6-N-acetylglucosamine synthase-like glycosyltransferase